MVVKDRPEVEIGAIDLSLTCSYASPTSIPKYLIDRTYAPRCLAEAVSEKGYIALKEFAAIVKKPQKNTLGLVRECLGNGSYKVYLPVYNANREIVERKDNGHGINFLFKPTRNEKEIHILPNGCMCDRENYGDALSDYVKDTKCHARH
jgi:hypothetical protein